MGRPRDIETMPCPAAFMQVLNPLVAPLGFPVSLGESQGIIVDEARGRHTLSEVLFEVANPKAVDLGSCD